MANPSQPGPDQSSWPSPELNPLENPTLGRNLGRWAQVYFTNPPEKRVQAVEDLLRELEEGDRFCPACRQTTAAGQKFCGGCGAPLLSVVKHGVTESHPPPPALTPESDLEWLRKRAITTLAEPKRSSLGRRWKYAIAGLTVVLLVFGYMQWIAAPQSTHSSLPASGSASLPPQSPRTAPRTLAQPASPAPAALPAPARTAPPDAAAASVGEPSSESGALELKQAQRLLAGVAAPRDAATAATWLWKAVRKQNITALLLLSDLYVSGDGVPRNCEQGQLLLGAAAKKGSASAAQKLRDLQATGCP